MKEVQMTFRVESELRTRFTAAAELDHRPAAQVLRELMRAYVGQARLPPAATAADTQQAFFLVLDDNWHRELQTVPVTL